ncbi:hypothetical protein SELMODRAFT_423178 [Selaginella moellendorffii]|uniref:HAUS augmin-like complex subunit 6 N-terminal domain-containing protein n=1 Tax=Selaginella moellendorffii TaxID=88036 RepID=D8SKU2_SELML|nr:hypothetical protein SELMODRAFT_423178 [Selaginella moellendorffii]
MDVGGLLCKKDVIRDKETEMEATGCQHSRARRAFQALLHFLLAAKDFAGVWPIFDAAHSCDFRKIVQRLINELEAQGALPRSSSRVSSLATCCGQRFVELLWRLSAHALREVHRRNFPADVAENPLPDSPTEVITQNSHASALLAVTKLGNKVPVAIVEQPGSATRSKNGGEADNVQFYSQSTPTARELVGHVRFEQRPPPWSWRAPNSTPRPALPSERAVQAARTSKMQGRATPSIPRPAKSMLSAVRSRHSSTPGHEALLRQGIEDELRLLESPTLDMHVERRGPDQDVRLPASLNRIAMEQLSSAGSRAGFQAAQHRHLVEVDAFWHHLVEALNRLESFATNAPIKAVQDLTLVVAELFSKDLRASSKLRHVR